MEMTGGPRQPADSPVLDAQLRLAHDAPVRRGDHLLLAHSLLDHLRAAMLASESGMRVPHCEKVVARVDVAPEINTLQEKVQKHD